MPALVISPSPSKTDRWLSPDGSDTLLTRIDEKTIAQVVRHWQKLLEATWAM